MLGDTLKYWLMIAWLLPLLGFVVEILFGFYSKNPRHSKAAAWSAVGCIGAGFLCSLIALMTWGNATHWSVLQHESHDAHAAHVDAGHGDEHAGHADGDHGGDHGGDHAGHADDGHADAVPTAYSGVIYTLAVFGDLEITIDYYIDSLTLVM